MSQTDVSATHERVGYGLTHDDMAFSHSITPEEVMEVGAAFLMAVGVCASLGHNSPAGMIDYVARAELGPMQALVWDAFAATRAHQHDASDRVWKFAGQRGLLEAAGRAATA